MAQRKSDIPHEDYCAVLLELYEHCDARGLTFRHEMIRAIRRHLQGETPQVMRAAAVAGETTAHAAADACFVA